MDGGDPEDGAVEIPQGGVVAEAVADDPAAEGEAGHEENAKDEGSDEQHDIDDEDEDGARGLQDMFNQAAKMEWGSKPCVLCYVQARLHKARNHMFKNTTRFFNAGGMDKHYKRSHARFLSENKGTKFQCKKCKCWFASKKSELYKWHKSAVRVNH